MQSVLSEGNLARSPSETVKAVVKGLAELYASCPGLHRLLAIEGLRVTKAERVYAFDMRVVGNHPPLPRGDGRADSPQERRRRGLRRVPVGARDHARESARAPARPRGGRSHRRDRGSRPPVSRRRPGAGGGTVTARPRPSRSAAPASGSGTCPGWCTRLVARRPCGSKL